MPWPANVSHPKVSIVMPVQRHRGKLLEALAAWSAQDYPREQLEFVIASTTQEPQIDAQVEAFFAQPGAPRGGLAYIKTENEVAQYAYAARYARGEWLMFTEPHCVPQPDCLRELIGTLIERDMVGGCGRTLSDHSTNRCARIEERMYFEDFDNWSHADDWRKFTKRCFALRRDVYRSIGALEDDYGWFSELVIAARLHAEGHRVGYVPTAAVQHFNATNLHEMFDYVWEYRREMARYLDVGSETLRPYFAGLSTRTAEPPPHVHAMQCKATRHALWQSLRHATTRSGFSFSKHLAAALGDAWCGTRLKLACGYGLARLRFACLSWSQEQAYRNFVDAADRLGKLSEAMYRPMTEFQPAMQAAHAIDLFPGESCEGLYGFHAAERHAGRMFRWTSPVASLVLPTPRNSREIALDLGDIAAPSADLRAYWNGQPLERGSAGVTFVIDEQAIASGGPQVLTLISPPFDSGDARETRALGVPLFGVHIAGEKQAARRRAA